MRLSLMSWFSQTASLSNEKVKKVVQYSLAFLQIHFPVLLFDFVQLHLTSFMIVSGASGRLDMIEMYVLFGVSFHILLGLTSTP